jgi:NitT/TauT family transport system substrate-binding protein
VRASARNSMFAAVVVCLSLALAGCGSSTADSALTPVTVKLAWSHQAQFAGMYAADQLGYYKDEGLDVTLVESGPAGGQVEAVLADEAEFGIVSADALLLARSKDQAVKAVAAIYRRSPRVYMSLAQSGITRPEDFAGKTIAVNKAVQSAFTALMNRVGLAPDEYTVVQSTPDMAQLYSGEVQVRSVYLTGEVLAARSAGYDVNIVYPDDYGVHNYGDVLFTSEGLIAANPDLVLRFVRATLAGWAYAVEHPVEVGAMVAKYKADVDVEAQNEQMLASLPLIITGEDRIGWMRAEVWAGMEEALREGAAITAPMDVTLVYTMKFVEQSYR